MQENIAFVKSGGFALGTNSNGFVKTFDGLAGLAAKGRGEKVLSQKILTDEEYGIMSIIRQSLAMGI
jgi:hypothetical protein